MNDFPDIHPHGYRIEKELGHNRAGGRVTYLAINTKTQKQVVIKQFQFAKSSSSWSEYDAYDREIELLKNLEHPGIPRYLDSFQTADGFCMVQEYKQAQSLSTTRSFSPVEIKQIAIALLEILIYLQNRIPPIIHRDIKPENVLVDRAGNVYLVDFGFARVGDGEVGVSSVVKGTLGFMPPEQIFNRQLTEASDLYGLGMSLICLLTSTKSDRIGDLVDISYRVSFKHLVPKLNMHWVNWLEKMVEPRLKDRFPNAVAALAAIPASAVHPPEAQFSQSNLEFKVKRMGEPLTQTVLITNPIPETTLEGEWEVVVHPNDPAAERYSWITIEPSTFSTNQVECQVTVDTRYLMAGKAYQRRLLLHTNTLVKAYPLNLRINTAPRTAQLDLTPYSHLTLLCLFSIGISWLIGWGLLILGTVVESAEITGLGATMGVAIGLEIAAWIMSSSEWRGGSTASTFGAVVLGTAVILRTIMGENYTSPSGALVITGACIGLIGGIAAGIAIGKVVEDLIARGTNKTLAIATTLLTATLGTSLGLGLIIGVTSLPILALSVSSGFALIAIILHFNLKRINKMITHRKAEQYFIRP